MSKGHHRPCPAEHAGWLVNPLRRLFQSPGRLLKPYVKAGMTAVDLGCGPGFFTIPMAKMVGEAGKVIAVDVQQAMLDQLKARISGREIEGRIQLHLAEEQTIGLRESADFVLAFYMVHEVPDQASFFQDVRSIVKPQGVLLVVEPPFGVSKKEFQEMLEKAAAAGFRASKGPGVFLSQSIVLS